MMASVSVVHNVLQQNNTGNNHREIIILRKPQQTQHDDDILITNPGRKTKHNQHKVQKCNAGAAPQPMAVARRNARERNRVKQVNNGFANLRQHIPNFIAAAFESNTRGGNKKLSKVETLRMAVEYIKSLEDLLALDEGNHERSNNSTGGSSISSFSPTSSSTHLPAYQLLSPSADEDDLSTNPTPPPSMHQFQYQIIPTNHLYEEGDNSENLEPLDDVDEHILADASLMDAADLVEFRGAQDLSLLNSDSLSPGMYSETSGDSSAADFKCEQEIPVISLKTENALPSIKSNVLNVMQWWDQQQQQQNS